MQETDQSLQTYIKGISKTPVLTRKEEVDLFKRLKRGNKAAREKIREKIITSNLRFVVKIAMVQGISISIFKCERVPARPGSRE